MPVSAFLQDAENHYNPRVAVTGFETYIGVYQRLSELARGRLDGDYDLRYGPGRLQTLDAFAARNGSPRPVYVYIHGGYWRAMDKALFSFVAEPFVAAGFPVAVLNYDLCPAVTLDALVAEVLDGIEWLHRYGMEIGGDGRVWLAGNSVGAHLTAMALATDWRARGLPSDFILGATAVTGIYDIEPVLHISVNADVRLTPEMAGRNSPLHLPVRRVAPLLLAAGGAEPAGWIAQTLDYEAHCRAAGCPVETLVLPGENHFSINLANCDGNHPLTVRTIERLQAASD